MDSYYTILELTPNATAEEIKQKYKFLAQAYHPDKFASVEYKKIAQEHFQQINLAYQVLSNPTKRAQYDQLHKHSKQTRTHEPIPPQNFHSNEKKEPHIRHVNKPPQTTKATQSIPVHPLGENGDHKVIDQLEREILAREKEIDTLKAQLPKMSQAHSGLIVSFIILGVFSLLFSDQGIQFTLIGSAGIVTGLGLLVRRYQIYQKKFLPTLEDIKQRKMELQRLEYARKSVKNNSF